MKDIALARRPYSRQGYDDDLRLVTTNGYGRSGKLMILGQDITLEQSQIRDMGCVSELWTLWPEAFASSSIGGVQDYLVLANLVDNGNVFTSHVFRLTDAGMEEIKESDLDPEAGATIEAGFLSSGTRVAQVLATEVRFYDKGKLYSSNFDLLFCYIYCANFTLVL